MPKITKDFTLIGRRALPSGSCLMSFITSDGSAIPELLPGQFVEIRIDNAPRALLRRPISVCDVKYASELVLFVKPVGQGTTTLTELEEGRKVNIMLPLGHGFTTENSAGKRCLLVGGGVGAAPLVYLARELKRKGAMVAVAIGGRTAADVEGVAGLYEAADAVVVSTDDGTLGAKGVVTLNPIFNGGWDRIYCCGPTPMMKAVGRIAKERKIWCEVSLENHMACGLGACLCCVENTDDRGNVCVCTEGPVFNINRLESWLKK